MNLNAIREQIEAMERFNQVEVLRILVSHPEVTINENKSGIHINLSNISEDILEKLVHYIKYVTEQEAHLLSADNEQTKYKNLLQG